MADVYLWKLQFGAICWRKMNYPVHVYILHYIYPVDPNLCLSHDKSVSAVLHLVGDLSNTETEVRTDTGGVIRVFL